MSILAQGTFSIKRAAKDGYSCVLSPETVVLNNDQNGNVTDYSYAKTTVTLSKGDASVTPVIGALSVFGCTATKSGTTVTIASVPQNTKQGYVDIPVSYGSFSTTKRFTFQVIDYTVSKNIALLTANGALSLKADKTTVDEFGKTVSQHTGEIKANADAIALCVKSTDFESMITQHSNAINMTVKSQVDTAVNNVQVGGRNLMTNGDFHNGTSGWSSNGYTSFTQLISNLPLGFQYGGMFVIPASNKGFYTSHFINTNALIIGVTYTISFYAKSDSNVQMAYGLESVKESTVSLATSWEKFSYQVTADGNNRAIVFYPLAACTLYITGIKVEEGTKATSWTPAPEDVDSNISLRPTRDEIKSQFTIDSGGVSIFGKKISLSGMVSFSSLSDSSAIDNRIKNAQNSADGASSTAGSAKSSADAANSGLSTLKGNLKSMAYNDSVSFKNLDSTIINGTHIITGLIDVNALFAQTINASYGTIKNLNIDTANITNAIISGKLGAVTGTFSRITGLNGHMSLSDDLLDFTNSAGNSSVLIGADVMPGTLGGSLLCPVRLTVARTTALSDYEGNAGLYLSVTGATALDNIDYQFTGNNAIYTTYGVFCGFRLRTRRINTSQTLSKMDSIIFVVNTSSDITITLRSDCEDGQIYIIKSETAATRNYTIQTSGPDYLFWQNNNNKTSINVTDAKDYFLKYDAINHKWGLGISNF